MRYISAQSRCEKLLFSETDFDPIPADRISGGRETVKNSFKVGFLFIPVHFYCR